MKVKKKVIKSTEKNDNQEVIEKAVVAVNRQEDKRWNMLMPELTELEYNVLLGLVEGRSIHEIRVGIKLSNPKDSYNTVVKRLQRKLNAFTLAHAVYKAVKLGLV